MRVLHFVKLHCVSKDLFIKKWFLFFCLTVYIYYIYFSVKNMSILSCLENEIGLILAMRVPCQL